MFLEKFQADLVSGRISTVKMPIAGMDLQCRKAVLAIMFGQTRTTTGTALLTEMITLSQE